MVPFIFHSIFLKLGTQRSEEHFRRNGEFTFGQTLEEIIPVGIMERETQWANFRDIMSKIDESMTKTDTKISFVMGNT